uniref:MD-2-related lipid-recognition domain-containing protein n=1 Tax=Musca domestica TaxID=7370 RepID=A0A1I8MAA5_MUSDO
MRYYLMGLLMCQQLAYIYAAECYRMKILTFRTTETPTYLFSMVKHSNQTLSSVTKVLETIQTPMWNIILIQYTKEGRKELKKSFYNSTIKVCDFWRHMKRIRFFGNLANTLFKNPNSGNMSLACPLEVGTYIMKNIHVPTDTGVLRYIYRPNTMYGLFGNVYSQLKNKKLVLKCSYEINGTVTKSC